MMNSKVQYRVHIPMFDTIGQPIGEHFAIAAHHWLYHAHPRLFESSTLEGPHRHIFQDQKPEDRWHLVTHTDDSPEADGYVKQLAAHIGDATNRPHIAVEKTGDNGVEQWHIPNPHYIPDMGAHYDTLEPEPEVGSWSPVHPEVNVPSLPYQAA
jgi:hypothetical protein